MGDTSISVGLSQSYIETLTKDLTSAEYCYNEYHIATQKAKDEYDLSVQWETCLKTYLIRIGTTYGMVTHLNSYIGTMEDHADKICTAVGLAKGSSDILMHSVRCLSEQNEQLKKLIKDVLEIIDCLNDPILDPNVSIMKCLNDLKSKVDAGLVATLDAVKELLALMKCMWELENQICNDEELSTVGLIDDLDRLSAILNCTYPRIADSGKVTCGDIALTFLPPSLSELNCPNCKNDCGEDTIPVPNKSTCQPDVFKPKLCEECGKSFHTQLLNDYKRASQHTCYAKCVWEYFADLEQKAKSNKNAIKAALDAAVGAKAKCK